MVDAVRSLDLRVFRLADECNHWHPLLGVGEFEFVTGVIIGPQYTNR